MMKKTAKTFRLSDDALAALTARAEQSGMSETKIIENLLLRDKQQEDTLFQRLDAHYHAWQTGVLLSTRQTERYCFQLIEMLNSLLINMYAGDEAFFASNRLLLTLAKRDKDVERQAAILATQSPTLRNAAAETENFYSNMKQRKDNNNE